jgi:hypothetical protein
MASTDPEKEATQAPAPPQASLQARDVVEISPSQSTYVDDAYAQYKDSKDIVASPEEYKRVLRKIDLRIIPILFVTYMLQYLDKNSINFSSVYGLQKGTHLVGQDYSWLGVYPSPLLCL